MIKGIYEFVKHILGLADEELHDILSGYHTLHDKLAVLISRKNIEAQKHLAEVAIKQKLAKDAAAVVLHAASVQNQIANIIAAPAPKVSNS